MSQASSKSKIKWDDKYSDRAIKSTLIELIFYVIFLAVTTFLAFQLSGARMFFFTQIMRKLFIEQDFNNHNDEELNFEAITIVEEFWLYCENVLLPTIYGDEKRIIEENKMIGLVRFRQFRVKNDSCKVHYLFTNQFKYCYGDFSRTNEDTKSLVRNGLSWEYDKGKGFFEQTKTYGILNSYPSGGFIQDLDQTLEENNNILKTLTDNNWIDRGTRAILIEFTVYNANTNLFCVVKLILELPPCGGIIPSYTLRTVKLLRFRSTWDYVILGVEASFALQIIYFTIIEIIEMRNEKCKYFGSFWNWIDLLIILLAYTMIAYSLFSFLFIRIEVGKYVDESESKFISFDLITFWQLVYNNIVAIVLFLIWIKLLKYISFSHSLIQFSSTLERCAKDLLGFSVMFLIVFIAFAQLGFLLFGTENEDFLNFRVAIFTLMRTILGDFNYIELERSNWVLGPIYFLAFIFLVFFVLLNMFLAIINDTYSEVKSEPYKPIHLWRVLRNLCRKNKIESPESSFVATSKTDEAKTTEAGEAEADEKFKQFVYEIDQLDKRLKTVEITISDIVNKLDDLIKNLENKRTKSK